MDVAPLFSELDSVLWRILSANQQIQVVVSQFLVMVSRKQYIAWITGQRIS
ncbi:hypothetical protein SDC9_153697 [bioreactor metagenome]|uniref:Uncharacterized protein n=1 Tax=bioreactor metagenome TaxID=1076179 RepID=A0A645EWN3_9ZZZZ